MWREELESRPDDTRRFEIYRLIEKHLDLGLGSQALREPRTARAVQESLIFNHRRLYNLHAWTVMPTHVHVLLTPLEQNHLGEIVKALKGFTGKEVNRQLGRSGKFWQEDYYDRWIRDQRHFDKIVSYIEWNPVKAQLCRDPVLWSWSSANKDVVSRLT